MAMTINFTVIQPADDYFPDALLSVLPDITLYCIGNVELLKERAIGICGSRNASADALNWAHKFGDVAASKGLVVVSGYARGIDRQAHKGALQSGGSTIAVLPEGIEKFRLNSELKDFARLDENFLAISMFSPDASWQSWRAMQRNKLIVGLSVGLFVVEAREKGGTIDAAMECVRQKKKLWAIAYTEDSEGRTGNKILLQDSAIPLRRLRDVHDALENSELDLDHEVKQLEMELV